MINFRANISIGLVVLLQVYFLVLEMFLWDKPAGLKAFGHDLDFPPYLPGKSGWEHTLFQALTASEF